MHDDPVFDAVEEMEAALLRKPDAHWVIAFSGGKDSSAALKIFLAAALRLDEGFPLTSIVYCDTGVENPLLDLYVKTVLSRMQTEFENEQIPVSINILKAPLHDRFFVKIIGRGYPPPTNSFRWCTKGLRINPVSQFIQAKTPENTVIVLGLRQAESQQRDRSMSGVRLQKWQRQREGKGTYDVFLPILNLDVPEVWDVIFALSRPRSISPSELDTLYRDASGECPVIRAPQAAPCASGRFGCWTCTVVRKDRSSEKLINAGHDELRPYLLFRNWLSEFRNDPLNRWPTKRNGNPGLGPFTIAARKEILRRVTDLEVQTRTQIIDSDEMGVIASMWSLDHIARLPSPRLC